MESENFVSHLPQPARYGQTSPQRAMVEMSAAATNSRIAMPPPPPFAGHKRQGSNRLYFGWTNQNQGPLTTPTVPEPTSKRKTLAERAGESKTNPAAPRSIAPIAAGVMSTIHNRNPSSFSQSYRSNSSASRDTSGSSSTSIFSASVGSGIRPPTTRPASSLGRPKSSLARERGIRPADPRPGTAQGTRGGNNQDGPHGKRMIPFPAPPNIYARMPVFGSVIAPPKRGARNMSPMKGPALPAFRPQLDRNASTSTIVEKMQVMSLAPSTPTPRPRPGSPSRIPRASPSPQPRTPFARDPFTPQNFTPEPITREMKDVFTQTVRKIKSQPYLTKDSTLVAWDPEEQYGNIERMYEDVCKHYKQAMDDNLAASEVNTSYKSTIASLEQDRKDAMEAMILLRTELETTKYKLESSERLKQAQQRDQEEEVEDLKRHHRIELECIRQSHRADHERLKDDQREEIRELKRRLEDELESERTQRIQALSQVSTQGALEKQRHEMDLESREHQIRNLNLELERLKAALEREEFRNDDLRQNLSTAGDSALQMESARQALQAKIEYLESDSKSQSEAYAAMERRMNEALAVASECEEKLRKEEMLRRKLHNQVQELKGNIRVFCRVRPVGEDVEETAKISFPESEFEEEELKDIEVKGPEETSSLGKVTTKTHQFSFDRVFNSSSSNGEIFEEISQLIQSALDGYNVCIFAYGQTGSGKTYTMSAEDGMIPRALRQIYTTSKELESRDWTYTMQGSFVEVYNEELRDLLGNDDSTPKKHQIIHDAATCETTITDVTTLNLDSQDQVEGILAQAMARRSVAATKANERSSRSHSVFILKLEGVNHVTGKKSKGTLNLVDLAGSERLSHSKAEGARLKETQNINKSLSCLGDVIGALGQQAHSSHPPSQKREPSSRSTSPSRGSSLSGGGSGTTGHIPYRNSKLTYLLQYSLGGNSKTLMFVMVAPEKRCLAETITSLKFADKVSRTRIGVAKRVR